MKTFLIVITSQQPDRPGQGRGLGRTTRVYVQRAKKRKHVNLFLAHAFTPEDRESRKLEITVINAKWLKRLPSETRLMPFGEIVCHTTEYGL